MAKIQVGTLEIFFLVFFFWRITTFSPADFGFLALRKVQHLSTIGKKCHVGFWTRSYADKALFKGTLTLGKTFKNCWYRAQLFMVDIRNFMGSFKDYPRCHCPKNGFRFKYFWLHFVGTEGKIPFFTKVFRLCDKAFKKPYCSLWSLTHESMGLKKILLCERGRYLWHREEFGGSSLDCQVFLLMFTPSKYQKSFV